MKKKENDAKERLIEEARRNDEKREFKKYLAYFRTKAYSMSDPAVSITITAADDDAALKQLCFRAKVKHIEDMLSVSVMEVLGSNSTREVYIYINAESKEPTVARLVSPPPDRVKAGKVTALVPSSRTAPPRRPHGTTYNKPTLDEAVLGPSVTSSMVYYFYDSTPCVNDGPKKKG